MSCMMSNPRQLAALATAAESLLNMGYEFSGYTAPNSLSLALSDCADKYGFYEKK